MGGQAFVATPFAAPGGRLIASPFQFLSDDDTFLRVTSANSAAGVTLAVQGRRLDDNGALQIINETHTPNTDRSIKTQDFKLGKGALLNLTVFARAGSPLVGQTYVLAQIIRNTGATAILIGTLLGGYVTSTQALGFPGSPIQSSTEGEPVVRDVLGTTPALGAAINETCPTGARWELMTLFAQLTTGAPLGSRAVLLSLNASGALGFTGLLFGLPAGDQGASVTFDWSWAQNLPPSFRNVFNMNPIPQRQFLRASGGFTAFGQGASDQWGAPVYQVREWLEVG